jgi:tRNA pseudouridine55 synthase
MADLNGFLLIDKPVGPTSHDVVDLVRRATGLRQVGHAGTLDPFASGLLIVAVGRATKGISQFVGLDKAYEAELKLGATSDTMDRTGQVVPTSFANDVAQRPTPEVVEAALVQFRGPQMQTPPMYSAKKINGQKLYELARQGKTVERAPVAVVVSELVVTEYAWPILKIRCRVSSGTYIRVLAHDIGARLGVGAYLENLRRTAIGNFKVENALPTAQLSLTNVTQRLAQSLDAPSQA